MSKDRSLQTDWSQDVEFCLYHSLASGLIGWEGCTMAQREARATMSRMGGARGSGGLGRSVPVILYVRALESDTDFRM